MRCEGGSGGVIVKALSGFYYVAFGEETIRCKARGRFRREGISPLVGDYVVFSRDGTGGGVIERVRERRNSFERPAVANVDLLVMIASVAIPVTDPYLIDRVTVAAADLGCGVLICVNKTDIKDGSELLSIYSKAGFKAISTSAVTGEGIGELLGEIRGKVSAFTGNSGVGKSSILNSLSPNLNILTGDISQKLGRGRHTTRHVELYSVGEGTFIADTPGFAAAEFPRPIKKERLQELFIEFEPYRDRCEFRDCAHIKERGCAVTEAVRDGRISKSRHASYVRLYDEAAAIPDWETCGI